MPLNANITDALALLGLRTLEVEQLRNQMELMTEQYNKLNEEKLALEAELDAFKKPGALREVK